MNWLTVGRLLLFFIGLIVLGSLSSRLLGIRLSWGMRLFAAVLGSGLGGVFTGLLWYNNRSLNFVPISAATNLFFTMTIAVLIGSLIGLMSVFLITSKGGPQLSPSFSLNEFLGYMGLFSSVMVMMRVVVAIVRSG